MAAHAANEENAVCWKRQVNVGEQQGVVWKGEGGDDASLFLVEQNDFLFIL